MTVKIDFLISPAYWVPPMSTIFWPKWITMKTSERVPSTSGTAWKLGALITVNWGAWPANSSALAWMNILRAKRLCQAVSVITRMGRR